MGLDPKYWMFIRAWLFMVCLLGTASAQGGSSQYQMGVFSYAEGNYADAETYLKMALKQNPDDAYVQFYLARTYLVQQRFFEAEPLFLAAQTSDPYIPGMSYDIGMLYYKMGFHDRALQAFEAVLAEDPLHAPSLYHAGTSLFMAGQYLEAIDYLERASAASDSVSPIANYYTGICYYRSFEYEKALLKFNYTASAAASTILREDARRWARITRVHLEQEKHWRLYAKTGVQYDDNVQFFPLDPDRFEAESDYAAVLFFSGSYVADAVAAAVIGAGYSHYQKFFRDFDEFNFTGSIGEVFVERTVGPTVIGIYYFPSYYWVDTESYLMQHLVGPDIRWHLAWPGEIGFSYSYARNKYFTDAYRDGHAHEFNFDYLHELEVLSGYVFSGAGYTNNNASLRDEYYSQMILRAGMMIHFLEQFRLRVQGDFRERRYDYQDSFFDLKRKDKRYGASGAVSWAPGEGRFDVSFEYDHMRNDSNVNDYNYRRNALGVFVSAGF